MLYIQNTHTEIYVHELYTHTPSRKHKHMDVSRYFFFYHYHYYQSHHYCYYCYHLCCLLRHYLVISFTKRNFKEIIPFPCYSQACTIFRYWKTLLEASYFKKRNEPWNYLHFCCVFLQTFKSTYGQWNKLAGSLSSC